MFSQSGQRNVSSNALLLFSLALAAKGLLHNLLIQLRVLAVSLKGCRWMNCFFCCCCQIKVCFHLFPHLLVHKYEDLSIYETELL